ncbi:MAG: hypothetical protein Q4G22_02565 [Paracoccus sp. (in: a-proteobacteria)]|uniref:hypothetical protein n=1 Tax=Paracoccus sp. TaxID=267 RepID=UPI0026E03579|nr:hypothetical protein [Paracoccus sp. (in: a-proteobacteria)]MDO5630701.1 hypothetical protein [Paracoccus sp. (in: a-proteobacteria)]
MTDGYAFLRHGQMIGAARDGRAMCCAGCAVQPAVLDLPGTEPTVQNCDRAMPGDVWLSRSSLPDPVIRRRLVAMAPDHAATLPPKSKEPEGC